MSKKDLEITVLERWLYGIGFKAISKELDLPQVQVRAMFTRGVEKVLNFHDPENSFIQPKELLSPWHLNYDGYPKLTERTRDPWIELFSLYKEGKKMKNPDPDEWKPQQAVMFRFRDYKNKPGREEIFWEVECEFNSPWLPRLGEFIDLPEIILPQIEKVKNLPIWGSGDREQMVRALQESSTYQASLIEWGFRRGRIIPLIDCDNESEIQ